MSSLMAGERWTYKAPDAFIDSRLIVGGIVSFAGHEPIYCCCITDAPSRQQDGSYTARTIPFLPLTETAFRETVVVRDGSGTLPAEFQTGLASWQDDPRGLTYFSIPFEGHLERIIALQMARIVGADVDTA